MSLVINHTFKPACISTLPFNLPVTLRVGTPSLPSSKSSSAGASSSSSSSSDWSSWRAVPLDFFSRPVNDCNAQVLHEVTMMVRPVAGDAVSSLSRNSSSSCHTRCALHFQFEKTSTSDLIATHYPRISSLVKRRAGKGPPTTSGSTTGAGGRIIISDKVTK